LNLDVLRFHQTNSLRGIDVDDLTMDHWPNHLSRFARDPRLFLDVERAMQSVARAARARDELIERTARNPGVFEQAMRTAALACSPDNLMKIVQLNLLKSDPWSASKSVLSRSDIRAALALKMLAFAPNRYVPIPSGVHQRRPLNQRVLRLDAQKQLIVLNGEPLTTSQRQYEIVGLLVQQASIDHQRGLKPENRSYVKERKLAGTWTGVATRKQISRLRKNMGGPTNSVIENRPRREYRINPAVAISDYD
jgi:hypothetical protein